MTKEYDEDESEIIRSNGCHHRRLYSFCPSVNVFLSTCRDNVTSSATLKKRIPI